MTIYSIYKATNTINGKLYIGFTKNGLGRIHGHRNAKRANNPFHNALRKYGMEAFTWEIIYQSKDQDHTLNVMESYFIAEYNSHIDAVDSNGYNSTTGGGASYILSDTAITSIRNKAKVQWTNPEYRNKMTEYNKTRWTNPEFLKNKKNGWEITTPTGEVITCVNLAAYCRLHNLDNGCMVSVSKNNRPQHKGYTCKRISFIKTTSYS
jgi:group I intron endonuclease